MLARLYDDPAHMDHVVDHLVATSKRYARAAVDGGDVMTDDPHDRPCPTSKACARARSPGPIRHARAFELRDLDGYDRLTR